MLYCLCKDFIEYNKNYRKTTGSVLNYHKYQPTDPITESKSYKFKTSIIRKTANNKNVSVEFSLPLKHLSNFWRTLNIPLINCEVSLTLAWYENVVRTDETI